VLITAQNHNYFIETDSLDQAKVEITYLSLNDGSLEGLRLKGRRLRACSSTRSGAWPA